jgi:hypothetical protein
MGSICSGIGLIALLIALLLWWLRRNSCRHDISLRNVAAATNAHAIRVSAYTPGAQIVNAAVPSGWTQTTNYPTRVLWKPTGGGAIPSGNPLPGSFSIWVQNNAQPDKRVLIEWLSRDGKEVLCKQLLRVGCGEDPALVPENEETVDAGASAHCRCLSAETDSDEESNEYADPDLSVDVGTPVQTGYLQVDVPYTIEVEPPTLQFTRQWDVTVIDEMGDEQPVTAAVSDNLNGLATFTLPERGNYNFYLTVTDPASCVSATDRDEDEYTDTAFNSIMMASGSTKILVNPEFCKPLEYHFINGSSPNLTVQDWMVYDLSKPVGAQLIGGVTGPVNTFDFTFPASGVSYQICLKTTDLGEDCTTITPTALANKVKFRMDYNSCVSSNFKVEFYNESTSTDCNATFLWDFGDPGSGASNSSTDKETTSHIYAAPSPAGNPYIVKLTMFVGASQFVVTQQLKIYQWLPDLTIKEICTDGHIIYDTKSPNPSWTFPNGVPKSSNKPSLRVCYVQPGPHSVKLYAKNDDGGYCEIVRDLSVPTNFTLCCPHDHIRDEIPIDYKGKSYRLKMLLRCYGYPHAVVFARCKLMVHKKGKWRRSRGKEQEIRIDLSGNLYTSITGSGCKCSKAHSVSGSKNVLRWARATKRFWAPTLKRTRMRQGDVVATFFVMIDGSDYVKDASGNDEVRHHSLSLWQHNCGCKEE